MAPAIGIAGLGAALALGGRGRRNGRVFRRQRDWNVAIGGGRFFLRNWNAGLEQRREALGDQGKIGERARHPLHSPFERLARSVSARQLGDGVQAQPDHHHVLQRQAVGGREGGGGIVEGHSMAPASVQEGIKAYCGNIVKIGARWVTP